MCRVGFGVPAASAEEVGADRMPEGGALRGGGADDVERGFHPVDFGHCGGPVRFHHRGRCSLDQASAVRLIDRNPTEPRLRTATARISQIV
jgi:hypothetical protein